MFRMKKVASYPSLAGNPVGFVEGIRTETNLFPEAAIWASEKGICIGSAKGIFENVTEDKYDMPESVKSACAGFRKIGDLKLFITTIKGA
jgi:hypothetical protein